MHQVKIIADWDFQLDCKLENPVELYVDCLRGSQIKNDSKKILLLFEPEEISKSSNSVIQHHKNFDYILTHNEQILNECSNAVLFEFGSTWIKDDYSYPDKKFEVSSLVGFKTWTEGHVLRHKLWYKQNRINIPKKFFMSRDSRGIQSFDNNPVLGESKDPLFDSQFHIVIENVKRKYWFTEKLIDCIKAKSVPVYWGCPNIDEYFNTDGFIIVNSLDEIVEACNNLTEEDYIKRLSVIEENYQKGKKFEDLYGRIKNKLKELS